MSIRLNVRMVAKPWGRNLLPLPFNAPEGQRIGEIWFEPQAPCADLLIKYIFTNEALSVQVHPSDSQAMAAGLGKSGKEECWLVIASQPGAKLGVGLRERLSAAELRRAALDGSIEQLLEWHFVVPGDFFYIPAGTVHAIGAGVSLIEVQQNSDITYRLFDYGRPRELHIDDGVAVANFEPLVTALRCHIPEDGSFTLVEGPLFRVDRIVGDPKPGIAERYNGPLLVIPLDGGASISGEFIAPGECVIAPSIADVSFKGRCLIAQSL